MPERWRPLYALNPMAGVVEGFRWALLGVGHPPGRAWLVSASASSVVLLLGGRRLLPPRRATVRRRHLTMSDVAHPRRGPRQALPPRAETVGALPRRAERGRVRCACVSRAPRAGPPGPTRRCGRCATCRFEVAPRRGRRHHRPQRRRQEHAAQDPRPDHRADRRPGRDSTAGSARCSRSAPGSTPS